MGRGDGRLPTRTHHLNAPPPPLLQAARAAAAARAAHEQERAALAAAAAEAGEAEADAASGSSALSVGGLLVRLLTLLDEDVDRVLDPRTAELRAGVSRLAAEAERRGSALAATGADVTALRRDLRLARAELAQAMAAAAEGARRRQEEEDAVVALTLQVGG